MTQVTFSDVTYAYPGQTPIFRSLDLTITPGWTGVVGPNGAGKTTLLRLAAGDIVPDHGSVARLDPVVIVPQTSPAPPDAASAFFADHDAVTWRLREGFAVEEEWLARWGSLSQGERRRLHAAVALWRRPASLLVDEPTNHLDAAGRMRLIEGLRRYRGIGLMVSHDRALLDALCQRILFVTPGEAVVYPGGYTAASAARRIDHEGRRAAALKVTKEKERIEKERRRRVEAVEEARRKNSGGKIDRKDHDALERLGRGRVTGKDARAGQAKRQIDRRWERLADEVDERVTRKERGVGSVAFVAERGVRPFFLQTDAATLCLGETTLSLPPLTFAPKERVGVEGANGAGKSRAVEWLLPQINLPPGKVRYLSQELEADQRRRLRDEALALPPDRQGELFALVGRLGADPKRVRESADLSPGEGRKLWLASALTEGASLLVLDEPTNHLDLPAIEVLEEGLSRFGGGLLVVSHDRSLLDRLCPLRWRIEVSDGERRLRVIL